MQLRILFCIVYFAVGVEEQEALQGQHPLLQLLWFCQVGTMRASNLLFKRKKNLRMLISKLICTSMELQGL